MNKLILGTILAVGLCYATENCVFLNIDEEKYSASFAKTYNFRCTGVKGYDYVDHEVLIKLNSLDAIFSSYYIDETERKLETFNITENENKDGEIEYIGYKGIVLYDEFHVEMKRNLYNTSFDYMEKTLINKWNKLKRYIKN